MADRRGVDEGKRKTDRRGLDEGKSRAVRREGNEGKREMLDVEMMSEKGEG